MYPFFRNFFHVQISGSNDQNAILVMQMIVILTKSIDRCFEKNAKFDMTPLLGGTDAVFSSLVHSFSWFVSDLPLNHLPFTLFSCYFTNINVESEAAEVLLVSCTLWLPNLEENYTYLYLC